ncbi:MAG: ABC transporter substrate-binding protein, partial [Chloroflexi bacterium]|nr:ABC transporter substrate-binding protein [Chloroflexota bacterium]
MKWQALTAAVGSILVVILIAYVALTATSESTPDSGGTYVEGIAGNPTAINPILAFSDADKDLVRLIFSGLTKLDGRGEVVPDLAKTWEISEDSHTYVFHLRDDVKWHDGTAFTAKDVVFTARSMQDPQFPGNPYLAEVWKNVTVEKTGDFTVKFTLKDAYAPFLVYTTIGILPAAAFQGVPVKEMGNTSFRSKPIGTGPFKLAELSVESALLDVNQDYYGEKRPYLSKIKLNFFPDYKTGLNALRQKGIQGLAIEAMEDVPRLKESKDLAVYEAPRTNLSIMFLNLMAPLFKDKAVRQALMYALDRQRIIDVAAGGLGQVAHSPIPPNT